MFGVGLWEVTRIRWDCEAGTHWDQCLYKTRHHRAHSLPFAMRWTQWESSHLQARKKGLTRTGQLCQLDLRLSEDNFLLFKPPILWYFIRAVWANIDGNNFIFWKKIYPYKYDFSFTYKLHKHSRAVSCMLGVVLGTEHIEWKKNQICSHFPDF